MQPLEDVIALRSLAERYAQAIDTRDRAGLGHLFMPTARLISYRPEISDGPAFELSGPSEIATLLDQLAHYIRTFHLVANQICDFNGDQATGIVYCLAHHLGKDDGGGYEVVAPVIYSDIYVRTDDGWKFGDRTIKVQWRKRRPVDDN